MTLTSFLSQQPVASTLLPLTISILNDWVVVSVFGQDSEKYLQSKMTADVVKMTHHQHLVMAHCDPRGKTLSSLRLFRQRKGFLFIERYSVRDVQLNELRKYSLFSRVTFSHEDDLCLLGISGFEARSVLESQFQELPDAQKTLINDGETTYLLWFEHPSERFLLVTNEVTAKQIVEKLHGRAQISNSQQWLALDIEAGIPVIDLPNVGKFIPQEINLQALEGISFEKGCYIGQETVARARFRGKNKRALWCLSGTSNHVPEIGGSLELKVGDIWRRTGTVLAAVQLNDNRLLIQAVMSNDLQQNSVLRVRDDINTLSIKSLPYSLKNEDTLFSVENDI